jgi:hypothetical protein
MNFAFFILLNAILLIRPEELLPDIAGWRLYLIVIILCTVTTLPGLLAQLSAPALAQRPITVCGIGLLVAMTVSQLAHGRFDVIDEQVPEFAKVLLYLLLLMAVVNTPRRMLAFIGWIVVFVVVLSTVAVLNFHEYITIESLAPVRQRGEIDPDTGEVSWYLRMVSSGIYNDPNDLCLILVTGSLCCLCRSAFAANIATRILWLAPIGWFIYSMTLTVSRGGLLGLVAGIIAYCYARYGAKKLIPLSIVLILAMPVVFGGAQTNFNMSGNDTSQERMRLWAEGLSLMLNSPVNLVVGIGAGQFIEEMNLVAHNSFVQAYVEMGLFGGTLFIGMFFLALWGLYRTRKEGTLDDDPMMLKLQPFVFAIVVGYAIGCYSVSRNFVVPTYLVLGLAASFIAMAHHGAPDWFWVSKRLVRRLIIVGVLGLVFLKLFTQTMVKWGA